MRRHPFNPNFGRRRLLQTLGVSATVSPFLPLLRSAAGGPETPPVRLLLMFHPHGTIRENWLPTGTSSDFTLPAILDPLAPYQDRLVVIDGLDIVPSGPPGGTHTVGPAYLFTGSPMLEGDEFLHPAVGTPHGWGSGPSVDQVVAEQIGTQTPFKSLEFGVQTSINNHPGARISYAGADQPLTPERNPHSMFERIFGDFGVDTQTAAKLKAERLSVIDVVKPQLQVVHNQVAADDRIKIEAHLDGIRAMEQALSAEYVCTPPNIGDPVDLGSFGNTEIISHQQLDLLLEAFACQATNVANVMFRVGENDNNPYAFIGIDDPHHTTTHAGDSDAAARAEMTTIYRWYAQQLAYLAAGLDAIEEPDGSTVLDNTLVVWGTEIAKGNNHSWENMPFVLLGGAGGRLQTQRFHQFDGENHCRLLTSICNVMGLPVTEFGGFDDGSGPLPGIAV